MKIGFIGAGNMATAIIKGIINNGFVNCSDVYVSDRDVAKLDEIKKIGVNVSTDNICTAAQADMVVFCVKPGIVPAVAKEVADSVKGKIVVSIAAGVSIAKIAAILGADEKIVRVMPNTPAMVGEGMIALCENPAVSEDELNMAKAMFDAVGKTVVIKENLIDAVIGVSGSGPAYIYMVIEAMADGGVLCGLPRDVAYTLAAQTVLGSAKMVLETGIHPGKLKDMVCSPGGTTIEAVAALENAGIRAAFVDAVKAAAEKSAEMQK